jgi:hypothetical protein
MTALLSVKLPARVLEETLDVLETRLASAGFELGDQLFSPSHLATLLVLYSVLIAISTTPNWAEMSHLIDVVPATEQYASA